MPRTFTSERMIAIWSIAKEYGFTNMETFWTEMKEEGWDFYDVLRLASP